MSAGQIWLGLGAVFGGSAVVLGAFGAHALRARLAETALQTWQTAVTYQFTHALALLVVGLWLRFIVPGGIGAARSLDFAGVAFAVGVVLFSGSLYLLALGGPRWLGPVTPLGGIAFIAGWLALASAAFRSGGAS
jgi:uncharacterized membrane protein YgdD (TMEM256/DUF423 family)